MSDGAPPSAMEAALERTAAGVVMGDPAGYVTYANPAFVTLWGYASADQIVGRHAREFWECEELGAAIASDLWTVGFWRGEQISLPAGGEWPMLIHEASRTGNFRSPKRFDPGAQRMAVSVETFEQDGHLGSVATFVDVTGQRRAEEELRRATEDKRALLREVQHRVRNNLQVISSLLSLRPRPASLAELDRFVAVSRDRVHSMALAHTLLCDSPRLAGVDFGEYLDRLLATLTYGWGGRVRVERHVSAPRLDADTTVGCGLIITELVVAAHQRAIATGGFTEMRIEVVERSSRKLALKATIEGETPPPPADHFFRKPAGGLRFVQAIAAQLQGHVVARSGDMNDVVVYFVRG